MKTERIRKKVVCLPLFAAALLMVTSCNNDTESTPNGDGRVALQATSGIQTRAHSNTWESGDAIGIYMLNGTTVEAANKKYTTTSTTTSGAFSPTAENTIYFPADGTKRDFMAYYPHAAIAADNFYNVDVTTQTTQKAIDLMAAAKVTNKHKDDANVAFTFLHKLVKLDITIKGDAVSVTDNDLTGTTVQITNQQTIGTYSVVDGGEVTVTNGTPTEIALLTNGLQVEGIVLPNTDTEGMELIFTVPTLNATFKWSIKEAEKSQKFEAGKRYKYTITISKSELSVTSTVTDWVAGNGENGESGEAE